MSSNHLLTFRRDSTLWQLDKLLVVLALTCALPLLIHALPIPEAKILGGVLLPIFYAPLAAARLFRPRVVLPAAVLSPSVNSLIFNVPQPDMAGMLTIELLIFVAVIFSVPKRAALFFLAPVGAYLLAKITFLILAVTPVTGIGAALAADLIKSWPGLLILTGIAGVIDYVEKSTGGNKL